MSETTHRVAGMTCNHCVDTVSSEVSKVAGVSAVDVDLTQGTVTVTGNGIDQAAVRAAITVAGYETVPA